MMLKVIIILKIKIGHQEQINSPNTQNLINNQSSNLNCYNLSGEKYSALNQEIGGDRQPKKLSNHSRDDTALININNLSVHSPNKINENGNSVHESCKSAYNSRETINSPQTNPSNNSSISPANTEKEKNSSSDKIIQNNDQISIVKLLNNSSSLIHQSFTNRYSK
jgi:hypothetical protein